MLAPSALEEIDFFSHIERPGVQIAKDFYALASENFAIIDFANKGCVSVEELSDFDGNQKLKDFLSQNSCYLARLTFSAKGLADVIQDLSISENHQCCISMADLSTFTWLSQAINRRIFYDGNFQSLREGAGLHAALIFFIFAVVLGWSLLVFTLTRLHVFLSPAEAIAFGVIATVGVPICSAMLGYMFGAKKADRYFEVRIRKIDRILEYLEKHQ